MKPRSQKPLIGPAMFNRLKILVIRCLVLAFVFPTCFGLSEATHADRTSKAKPATKPNVLLIAVDDLNDWVGCLGGHPQARSPHIDRLAKRGTLFSNAHCQAPICNPSRTSIMYGLRPSKSGVYMNSPRPWTVATLKNRVTLSRHFAANGYQTYTTGKIYHGSGLPKSDFDVVGPRPGQKNKRDRRLVPPTQDGAKGLWDFGPQKYDESLFQDHESTTWAIEQIQKHPARKQANSSDKPFFLSLIHISEPTRPY